MTRSGFSQPRQPLTVGSEVRSVGSNDRRLMDAQVAAARFFRERLLESHSGWPATHLTQRGLGHLLRSSSPWKVGYAPDGWAHLVDHLRGQGIDDETLLGAGLASATRNGYLVDRFRDRIIFPAWDSDQHLVGFVGRARGGRFEVLELADDADLPEVENTGRAQ